MLLVFLVIWFPFWWLLFWVTLLVWFMSEGGSHADGEDEVFSDICGGCPWNVLFDDWVFAFSFAINLSQFSVLAYARIWKRFGDLYESLIVSDEFRFFLFDIVTVGDSRCLSIFSVKTLMILVLFSLCSLRYFNCSLSSLISDLLLLHSSLSPQAIFSKYKLVL